MITDRNRSDRWGGRLGYQMVGERAVLRFGPVTGPMPRAAADHRPDAAAAHRPAAPAAPAAPQPAAGRWPAR